MDPLEKQDDGARGSESGSFQALRPDVTHSPTFDGQALQDEDEAELLRDDEERENELKELLTTAFDDEDGDLLEDDCSSESSQGSHDSGRHSVGQRGPSSWHRLHDGGVGRLAAAQTVSTPVAAHALPPLLTPCYDAPARQQAALRQACGSAGGASPEQQRLQSEDSRPRTAASGRSRDTSGKSGDSSAAAAAAAAVVSGNSRSSSSSVGGSCAATPSRHDQRDAGRPTVGYLRHQRRAHPDAGSALGERLMLDMASSSGSSSCLQSSSASLSHYVEQFSNGEGALLGSGSIGTSLAARSQPLVHQRPSPGAASMAAYQRQRRAASPSPEHRSPLPPRDDGDGALQADYFYQGVGLHSDGKQLEILLHAKGRQLQDLTERYELLQLDSAKEIRLLKHQLALMEGENRGLDGSLKEARSLLAAAAEERQRWHTEAEQQQAAVRRLAAERDRAIEEQHNAEATAEALSQQLLTVGGSDGHARARQQHDAVIAALAERHEAALADKQRVIADLTAQLRAQKDECECLRSELAAARLAAENKQAEHADIVNKLAKSLDECQRQNNDLLLTGTTQELMKLKVELQQASASRLLTEQLCSSLESEVEHLKEQLSMYEAACSLGVITAPAAAANATASVNMTASTTAAGELEESNSTLRLPPLMDESCSSQKLSWRTPAISKIPPPSDSAIPRSPSPINGGGASPMLKSELHRALLSTKTKCEQISALQATVRQLQVEAHDAGRESATLKQRLAEAEALLRDREAELQLYKTAAEQGSSITEVRSRKELDGLRTELQTVKADLEETTRRLHEVAASEECLNDINDELRRQMAQLVKDFDEDKRASLDKCQETLMRHHEDVKQAYVAEQQALMEHELVEQEARSRAILVRLRQELDDKEQELTSIKEQYVQLAEEKRRAAELAAKQMAEVRRSSEAERESALRSQLDAQRLVVDGAVLEAQRQWEEQRRHDQTEASAQTEAEARVSYEQLAARIRAEHQQSEREAEELWQRRLREAEEQNGRVVAGLRADISKLSTDYKQLAVEHAELQSQLERLRQPDAAGCTASAPITAASTVPATGRGDGTGSRSDAPPGSSQLGSSLPARLSSALGDGAPTSAAEIAEPPMPRGLSASYGPPSATTVAAGTTIAPAEGGSRSGAIVQEARAASDRRLASVLALHAAEMARLRAQHEADRSRLLRLHADAVAEQRALADGRALAAAAETQQACEARFSEQLATRESALRADYEQRVADLHRDLAEMRALARRLEESLESSRRRHSESVAELTARHDRSLAEARAQHDRSLADVRQRHEENLRCALAEAQRMRATEVERAGLECKDFNAELQRACSALERQQASQEQQRAALEAALREQTALQAALQAALDGQQGARDELQSAEAEQRRLRAVLGEAEAERDRLRVAIADREGQLADAERRLATAEASARGAHAELERQRGAAQAAADGERDARRALLACREDAERLRAAADAGAEERRQLEQVLHGSRTEQMSMRAALLGASELRLQTQEALQRSEERREKAEQSFDAVDLQRQRLEAELGATVAERERLEAELRLADDRLRSAETAAAELRAEHRRVVDEMAVAHERRLAECAERHSNALSVALEQTREEAERDKKAMASSLERLTAEMKLERERLAEQHNQRLAAALDDATNRAKHEFSELDRRLREQVGASLDEAHCRLAVVSAERDRALLSANAVCAAATDLLKVVQKHAPAQFSSLGSSSDASVSGDAVEAWDAGARCSALQQSAVTLGRLLGDTHEKSSISAAQLARLEVVLQRAEGALQEERETSARRIAELESALAAAAGSAAAAREELTQQRSVAAEHGCSSQSGERGSCALPGDGCSIVLTSHDEDESQRRYAEVLCSVQEDVSSYVAETNRRAAGVIHTEVSAARSSAERLRRFCIKSLKRIMSGQKENQQLVGELQQLRTTLAREEWKPKSSHRTAGDAAVADCRPCSGGGDGCCCCRRRHCFYPEGGVVTSAAAAFSAATAGSCCNRGGAEASALPHVNPTQRDGTAELAFSCTSIAGRPSQAATQRFSACIVTSEQHSPGSGALAMPALRQDKLAGSGDLSLITAQLPEPAAAEPRVLQPLGTAAGAGFASSSLPASGTSRSSASASTGDRGCSVSSNDRVLASVVMSMDGSRCRENGTAERIATGQLLFSAKLPTSKRAVVGSTLAATAGH